MRHSRSESATIASCAASHGVTPRAVREWRRRDDPRWKAWLVRSAKTAVQLDALADPETSDPSTEAEAARRRFAVLQKMLDEATARGEVAGLPILLRSAQEAQRLLSSCRTAEAEWELQQHRVVRIEEVADLKDRFLIPLLDLLKSLPDEIAEAANPERPDIAREALSHWMANRFRVAWQESYSAIESLKKP